MPMEVETSHIKKRMKDSKKRNNDEFDLEKAYFEKIMKRIEVVPRTIDSLAGLKNGAEAIFLRVYNVSGINRVLEFSGFGFYHTAV